MATRVASTGPWPLTRQPGSRRLPVGLGAIGLVLTLAWWAPVTSWPQAEWRTLLLVIAAIAAWALEVAPDSLIAIGFGVAYLVIGLGPVAVIGSGFASPTWLLSGAFLVTAAALRDSTVLERVALRVLLVLPHSFGMSTGVLLVGGLVLTALVPSNIGRAALLAPIAVALAHASGYTDRSRSAAGLGFAAFTGAGLFGRYFLTGGVLNPVGMSLIPPDARLGWGAWALAAAPSTIVVLAGVWIVLYAGFRPAKREAPASPAALAEKLAALGPLRVSDAASAAVSLFVLVTLVFGACFEVSWACAGGSGLWLGLAVLAFGRRRLLRHLPLLAFLGVVLSFPAVLRHAGIESRVAGVVQEALGSGHYGVAATLATLFALTVLTRFVLSEWVAIPVLTMTFLPAAAALSLQPWVIAFVVLVGSNVWLLPYQFTTYAAFLGASERRLFTQPQAWPFSIGYLFLALAGLLVSLPLWRVLGLVG